MWPAFLLGSGVGIILNLCADWLPQGSGARLSMPRHVARWSVLLLVTAGLAVYLQQRHGWDFAFAVSLVYNSVLSLIAVIDLEHSRIPNAIVGVGLGLALAFNLLRPVPGLLAALGGAAVGGGLFLLLALARRNALGMGDVKLAFLIGMMTGFPWVLQALSLGIVLGGLAAAVLLLTRLRQPKQYMPYAPYLVAGSMATLLQGPRLATWYARLLGSGG